MNVKYDRAREMDAKPAKIQRKDIKYSKDDIKKFKEVCPSKMLFWPDDWLVEEMKKHGWQSGGKDN